ncbi:MAG: ethanolamine ammonia-lyase reactivating factor EutA [Candidatus Kariarchaeaceae archaeon]|jgi:ethanolamine utilization protein EutA
MVAELEQIDLLSVGIDVGSSTSHLVFSNLVLRKDLHSTSKRFEVVERNIIYEGRIIDTPLLDKTTIDIESLSAFFREEYARAGIQPDQIDTGAVIVTGETAKKGNAKVIVEALSEDAGKFVAATAGPNFESLVAALGSGSTNRSKIYDNVVLSADIGGGTSNIAISSRGNVVSTACVSVGGRLLAITGENKIWRIDEPARIVMNELNLDYKVGDVIPDEDIKKIANKFAEVLIEVITGPTKTSLAKLLMMTEDLDFSQEVDEITFSGGVSEFIFGDEKKYNDMGHILAEEINSFIPKLSSPIIEPANKIRATVIGAGAYSLSISGSTCFLDESLYFPIKNIPVITVNINRNELSEEHVKRKVKAAFTRFDIDEGSEIVALYLIDPVRAAYARLKLFAQAIEASLPNSIKNEIPVILIFARDIGNSVGNVIRRETQITDNLLCLDELVLQDGDWIDIGAPLVSGQVFPVTVKSLVFQSKS